MYIQIYMHVIAINEKRSYNFEEEERGKYRKVWEKCEIKLQSQKNISRRKIVFPKSSHFSTLSMKKLKTGLIQRSWQFCSSDSSVLLSTFSGGWGAGGRALTMLPRLAKKSCSQVTALCWVTSPVPTSFPLFILQGHWVCAVHMWSSEDSRSSQPSPSTMWVLGIPFRPPGLATVLLPAEPWVLEHPTLEYYCSFIWS